MKKASWKNKVKLTHLDKIYFPKDAYTKGDLIAYYQKITPVMFPYLRNRAHSLNRHPDGIAKEGFYQKDIDFELPDFVKIKKIYSESDKHDINYMVCANPETILYMVNLGCIEINPWLSRIAKLEYPDFLLIDLDPADVAFAEVVKAAQVAKEVLDKAGIKSFCKTSGKTGLHILVSTGAKYKFEQVRQFAKIIATMVWNRLPKTCSIERMPEKRRGKVYIDFLQNSRGQTMAAPYSVRPVNGAPVSTPILWKELNKELNPDDFNIKTIFARLDKMGDIFRAVLEGDIDIEKSLQKLRKVTY